MTDMTSRRWESVLKECREKNKGALARRGRKYPGSLQQNITDEELIKQISSLGAFDHPLYPRLMGEANLRWGIKE